MIGGSLLMLTKNYVNSLFIYKNGDLYWKVKKTSNTNLEKPIRSKDSGGYRNVRIDNKLYRVHRIIFLMFNGYLPEMVDHINRNKEDNTISNLRAATRSQNGFNRESTKTRNIYWNKNSNKWQVSLRIDGKNKSLGYYGDLELARLVAQEARLKYHKEFVNYGDKR